MKRLIFLILTTLAILITNQCKSAAKKAENPPVALPEPPKPEPVVSARAVPDSTETEMEIAVKPSLNLRAAAGLRGRIIGQIPYGSKIAIVDRLDDDAENTKIRSRWYKVRYDGETGFVNAKYLREAGDDRIVKAPKARARKRRKR